MLHLFVHFFIAPSCKRSREVAATEASREVEVAEAVANASEGAQATEARIEAAVAEPPRKRVLLILSEGEDVEEAPPATVNLFISSRLI